MEWKDVNLFCPGLLFCFKTAGKSFRGNGGGTLQDDCCHMWKAFYGALESSGLYIRFLPVWQDKRV